MDAFSMDFHGISMEIHGSSTAGLERPCTLRILSETLLFEAAETSPLLKLCKEYCEPSGPTLIKADNKVSLALVYNNGLDI
jgi:hypothetical protein